MHNCGVSHLSSPLLMTLPHKIVPTFFQKRGTRLQANSVKVEQNKGGAAPFFLLDFCSINTCLVQLIRFKTLRIFCHSLDPTAQFLFSQCFTNYLLKDEYQIFFYSCTYLCRVKQAPLCHLQVTHCWLGLHHD